MADFLLELRSEEIPARMQAGARAELEKLFRREMDAAGVTIGDITIYSTPRRLALIARDLPTETEAMRDEAKGPPEGAPDQAVDGFCRKNGVTREQLEVRDVKGRNTYFAVIEKPGQAVKHVLAEAIPAIIRDFSWPKSQRWGDASISTESTRWVRPLSGIVALFDGGVVDCSIGDVASGRETVGHRFHSSGAISIDGTADYADKLRAAHVIVDHEERQNVVREGARKAAEEAGLALVEDEGLVIENAGLTEWPVPLLGRFDAEYLDVPPEVIQLTARVNQKYFVCEDANGKLANAFICTANIDAVDPAVVIDGNRKVLAARLSDARFFWELDQKTSLAEHAKKLERITFHEKLGTVADKVERVAKLARWLCEEGIVGPSVSPREGGDLPLGSAKPIEVPAFAGTQEELADLAEQAARLCKADLVTEMVGEFPELQGLMGGYYAEKEGLPQEVSDAIRDHYKPVGQGDEVPTAPVTVAVSLADKLDTLAGFFMIDQKPTGSKDPFALRRAALGILETLARNELRIELSTLLERIFRIFISFDRHDTNAFDLDESEVADPGSALNSYFFESVVSDDKELRRRYHKVDLKEGWKSLRVNASYEQIEIGVWLDPYSYTWEEYCSFDVLNSKLLNFFADRLKVQQREAGIRHDLIDAVFALGGEDDLVRLLARVKALQSFIETEDGANLLAGYKRAANILKKEGFQSPLPAGEGPGVGGATSGASNTHPQPLPSSEGAMSDEPSGSELSYSPDPSEKALIDALSEAEPKAAAAIEAEDFATAMSALATLRAPIDRFFEDVIVNAEEKHVRAARLTLLSRFRDAVYQVADFSRIEG